jgi:hypothetical protein
VKANVVESKIKVKSSDLKSWKMKTLFPIYWYSRKKDTRRTKWKEIKEKYYLDSEKNDKMKNQCKIGKIEGLDKREWS